MSLIIGLAAGAVFGALAYRIALDLYAGETAKNWARVPRLAYSIIGAMLGAAAIVGTLAALVAVVALVVI